MSRTTVHRAVVRLAKEIPWADRPDSAYLDAMASIIDDYETLPNVRALLFGGPMRDKVFLALTDRFVFLVAGGMSGPRRSIAVPITALSNVRARESSGLTGTGRVDVVIDGFDAVLSVTRCPLPAAQWFMTEFDRVHRWHVAAGPQAAPTIPTERPVTTQAPPPASDEERALDLIRKLKSLLDEGLITHEEYDAKKTRVLASF